MVLFVVDIFNAICIFFFFQSDVEKKIKGVLEPLSLFTTYGDEEGMEDESHVPVYHHVTYS